MSAKSTPRIQWAPAAAALVDATRAVSSIVFDGRSADVALSPFAGAANRAAVRAITLGTLRWFLRLAPAVESLLSRPEGLANEVRALLIVAAHQIEYSRNPAETNAYAAVDAARMLGQQRAAGLVNAVLRRFVAERRALLAQFDTHLAVRTAHPQWMVEAFENAWPRRFESILEANNAHPPMVLRVDLSRDSVSDYLAELATAKVSAQPIAWAPSAIQIERPVAVASLPGFKEGRISVQDAGAQLAAELLDARSGMRVLDACAAPGGKTGHLLERADLAELVAVDIDPQRTGLIRETLQRLQRSARVVAADVSHPESFWDGKPFDRILIDAPCSSTGVIRRHPDIKLLRRASDIAPFTATQRTILRAGFSMLAPGGRLLYATCSVLPEENERVVADFLEAEPLAREAKTHAMPAGAVEKTFGFQLLPGAATATDGFYYACLEKTTPGT